MSPDLIAPLVARGISVPTPIQAATVPDALRGRDVVGGAPTGSGKTVAFGLALVARTPRARPGRPTGLVLTPTRELARQVHQELQWLGAPRRMRVASCYGGVGYGAQRAALRRGIDVLVACPGRLLDLVGSNDVDLRDVVMVVVDEADRMADMGFLPTVRSLLDQTSPDRQTLLFSATIESGVEKLVRDYQAEPERHLIRAEERNAPSADHHFWSVTRDERVAICADVVKDARSTIVFCRTKRGTDRVVRQLATYGLEVAALHGERSQRQREQALDRFRRGQLDALIATDVAARGIHVDGVECVVHFDPPEDFAGYTHRSGRTARAGATGTVITLVQADQRREVARFQRALGLSPAVAAPTRLFPVDVPPRASGETAIAATDATDDRRRPNVGRVKWFNRTRGFGIIGGPGDRDVFVHHSSIESSGHSHLEEGQRVAFDIGPGRKGDEARRVRVLT